MYANVLNVLPSGIYEACWLFEYTDGRRKKGVYNNATQKKEDSAWAQNKTGLLRASILARCGNRVERVVVDCPGQDFCNFEWVSDKNGSTGVQRLAGITIVTRTERATFYLDGKCEVNARDNSEDKLFHFGGAI
jgi:hypothetical protein